MKKREGLEITTFKLRCSLEEFLAANVDVDAWLTKQPGFLLRRVAQEDDGTVVDMLLWASVRDGERAAERLLRELAESPVHAQIDPRTVRWRVMPVHRGLGAAARPSRS